MLSNFLSKNLFSKNEVSAESQQAIKGFLDAYRSDIFPQGILSIAQAVSMEMAKKSLVIKLSLPFPCDGELYDIAEQLTELVQQPISLDAEYHIAAVRQHKIQGIKNIIAEGKAKLHYYNSRVNDSNNAQCSYVLDAEWFEDVL